MEKECRDGVMAGWVRQMDTAGWSSAPRAEDVAGAKHAPGAEPAALPAASAAAAPPADGSAAPEKGKPEGGGRSIHVPPRCAVETLEDGALRGFPSGEVGRGVSRRVVCTEALAWLRTQPSLGEATCVVTSLPDILEVELGPEAVGGASPSPRVYEEWFVGAVSLVLSRLHPSQVAIFYQTDGRASAEGGAWLSKSTMCHLGARAAGAACVWHRIVCAAPPGQQRTGRPGYAHLLCFSRQHTMPPGTPSVDVVADRGYMSWPRAMGAAACDAAVSYCLHVVHAGLRGGAAAAPPLVVLDPFCGEGSVLAAANAVGVEAVGVDMSRKRCRHAAAYVYVPR